MQNAHSTQKAGKQYFHYRLVEDAESQAMTGYQHNGVVPILMKTKYERYELQDADHIQPLN